jgi:hypothetical protein
MALSLTMEKVMTRWAGLLLVGLISCRGCEADGPGFGGGGGEDPSDSAPPDDEPDWDPGDWNTPALCGELAFEGLSPSVDGEQCENGSYPSLGAVQAASLCGGEVAAVHAGVGYPDLEAAVGSAGPGGSIYVCPGTHPVSISLWGGAWSFEGVTGDPSDVVLDGEGEHVVLSVSNAQIDLIGLGFTGGSSYDGGALDLSDGHAFVRCCSFEDNTASYEGGAINAGGHGPILLAVIGSAFEANQAGYAGSAISFGGYGDGQLLIANSSFVGNLAETAGGTVDVGAYALDHVVILDSSFEDNRSESAGAALRFGGWGASTLTVRRSALSGNHAVRRGAVSIETTRVHMAWLEDSDLVGGTTDDGAAALEVAGSPECAELHLVDSAILQNVSEKGPAVTTGSTTWLRSISSDWGAGESDNHAYDLSSPCGILDDLGGSESFTCEPDGTWY